jgi:hypothetical protein
VPAELGKQTARQGDLSDLVVLGRAEAELPVHLGQALGDDQPAAKEVDVSATQGAASPMRSPPYARSSTRRAIEGLGGIGWAPLRSWPRDRRRCEVRDEVFDVGDGEDGGLGLRQTRKSVVAATRVRRQQPLAHSRVHRTLHPDQVRVPAGPPLGNDRG